MREQQNPSTPQELHQPLLFAPSELLACGLRDAHHHPLVGERTENGVRSWRTSPALVVVPAAFLLTPGIAGLLAAADEESALDVAFGATPPVVIVIFDQLPLISLLDADGRIDPALYPHFAALASESTWFRNASAIAEYTSFALPAILTGNYPERGRLPVAADYPENLFTLLGGRYRLHVQEPLTELCPAALCPPRRAPPTARLAGILSDLAVVYLAVTSYRRTSPAPPPSRTARRRDAAEYGWR